MLKSNARALSAQTQTTLRSVSGTAGSQRGARARHRGAKSNFTASGASHRGKIMHRATSDRRKGLREPSCMSSERVVGEEGKKSSLTAEDKQ